MNETKLTLKLAVVFAFLTGWTNPGYAQTPPPPPANRLADVLQPFVDARQIAGAVTLVADRDGVLDVTCVGDADLATHAPMRPDSLFWVASQTKPFTAAALMSLVDEGKVNVDDPVEKYLPNFRGQMRLTSRGTEYALLTRPVHPITIRNLLTHTSGLPYGSALEGQALDALPLAVAVSSYAMTPLNSEPDALYSYANSGLNTVGRIVEVVSGQPYADFLQTRLLGPLALQDTTFWPDAAQLARLAKVYAHAQPDEPIHEVPINLLTYPLDDRLTRHAIPAAGLFSTAGDCARFCRMILRGGELDGHRYLSEAAVREMTTRQTSPKLPVSYGFGWSTDGERCGHSGAYGTDMGMDRERGLVYVFMVQEAGYHEDAERCKRAFWEAANERFGKRRVVVVGCERRLGEVNCNFQRRRERKRFAEKKRS